MGHVDVGKTTLLDALRKSDVAANEAGGITQSIGAFRVTLPLSPTKSGADAPPPAVTFIDTPGHEAFTSMRAHGAGATDVVVVVVAADDGVMPQSVEAVKHARASGVPIIVAINKCDVEGADAGRVAYQMLDMAGVNTEVLGGDVQCVEMSAKTGAGIEALVDAILLQAELLDLRAEAGAPGEAVCLESRVDKQMGQVAAVVVKWGTVKVGDFFVHTSHSAVVGDVYGRVRAMFDSAGACVQEARPGDAVGIVGFKGVVLPGSEVVVVEGGEKAAKARSATIVAENCRAVETEDLIEDIDRRAKEEVGKVVKKAEKAEVKAARYRHYHGIEAPPVQDPAAVASVVGADTVESAGENGADVDAVDVGPVVPVLNVVLKADVQGGADAVAQCIERLSSAERPIRIVQTGVGEVTENDLTLASATRNTKGNVDECLIVAFNVRVSTGAKRLARRSSIDLVTHKLIYKLEEDLIRRNEESIASRQGSEEVVAVAGCSRVFDDGAIAGVLVQDGKMELGKLGRVMRLPVGSGTVREMVHEETITSLKQFAKDVRSVSKGEECGIGFAEWKKFAAGDVIECVNVMPPPVLGASKGGGSGSKRKRK